jgi:hypothetical protein
VTALKGDLQCVLADQRDILDSQLLGIKRLDPGQSPRGPSFTTAFGAWASPPELLTRVGAPVAAFPLDHHHLALAVDVDV